ncbi:hypothetical protein ACFLZ3_04420, partial [Candidatus Omnitrophota bacterium]
RLYVAAYLGIDESVKAYEALQEINVDNLVEDMRLSVWYANIINSIVNEYLRAGRKERALEISGQVLKTTKRDIENNQVNSADNFVCIMLIVKTFLEEGERESAIHIASQGLDCAQKIQYDYNKEHAFSTIANFCVEIGFHDQALEAINLIESNFPRLKTIKDELKNAEILGYFNGIPQYKDKEINKYYRLNENYSHTRCNVYSNLLKDVAQSGNYEDFLKILRGQHDYLYTGSKVNAFAKMAEAFAKTGEMEKASQLLLEALILIKEDGLGYFNIEALINVAATYNLIGLIVEDEERKVFREIIGLAEKKLNFKQEAR